MLDTIAFAAAGLALVLGAGAVGLSAAAPERVQAQPFTERVASGAASLMMKGIAAGYSARHPAPAEMDAPVIVHVTFTVRGDLDDFAARMDGFAPFLSNTPGLAWKVWALDRDTRAGSGTYLFETRHHAQMYLSDVLPEGMSNVPYIADIEVAIAPVMTGPSSVTHAGTAVGSIVTLEGRT